MPAVRELHPGEEGAAVAALLELRPQRGPAETLQRWLCEQRAAGLRLAGSFEDGHDDAAAVAGFRTGENLAWGRFLYVDDLVTRESLRGRGHGAAVMRWLDAEARRHGCDELHLDSGTVPQRHDAHALYFRHGLRITAHHFVKALR